MRAHALPLQLLLVLALLLNGIAGAMAGVRASVPDARDVATSATAETTSPDHCGTLRAEAVAVDAASHAAPCCDPAGDTGCDGGPQCVQACMHAAVAIASHGFAGLPRPRADAILHPLASGHPAPPLRSPIRPPIA